MSKIQVKDPKAISQFSPVHKANAGTSRCNEPGSGMSLEQFVRRIVDLAAGNQPAPSPNVPLPALNVPAELLIDNGSEVCSKQSRESFAELIRAL